MGYFKDLGGMKTKDDKIVKHGYLIKSSYLKKAKQKKSGAKKIIDMRIHDEKETKPEFIFEGVEYLHMPVFNDTMAGVTHENKGDKIDQIKRVPSMLEIYKYMVSDEYCYTNLSKIMKEIVCSNVYPVEYHCAEGKDRTGIITMLLYYILGVDEESIINDYLYVNKKNKFKSNVYYTAVLLMKRDKALAQKIKDFTTAHTEYLLAAIESIKENFGSVDDYIRNQLKITDEEKEKFRQMMLK